MLDVATPAAVVDLDRLEANLARWQEHCDRVGLSNRPHVKTHKCVEIARRQVRARRPGDHLPDPSRGGGHGRRGHRRRPRPVQRRRRPQARAARPAARDGPSIQVSADDPALLPGLAGAASDAGRELGVLVDCDTGLGRTGVASPEEAAELAAAIARTPGLRFTGLLTFPTPPGRARVPRDGVGPDPPARPSGRDGIDRWDADDVALGRAAPPRHRVPGRNLCLQRPQHGPVGCGLPGRGRAHGRRHRREPA